jgi:hypothetical protein
MKIVMKLKHKRLVNDMLVCIYIPLLPLYLHGFYNHLGVKIGRFIGGISIILYITDIYRILPYNVSSLILYFTWIQLFQIFIISMIKVLYGLYLLHNKIYIFEYISVSLLFYLVIKSNNDFVYRDNRVVCLWFVDGSFVTSKRNKKNE